MMRPRQYLLLEFPPVRFAHQYEAGFNFGLGHRFRLIEVALSPCCDHIRYIDGVASPAEQVIRASERDEALRMLCSGKDMRGILDPDETIGRRMKHQQRFT